MRLIRAAISVILVSLAGCHQYKSGDTPAPAKVDVSQTEEKVYRAFIASHLEDDFKTHCAHAVLDTQPLAPDRRDPTQWFALEPLKPPSGLIQQFSVVQRNQIPLVVAANSFFIPVDDAVLGAMFRENCSLDDMKKMKCGWLQFRELYADACGHWHFSHVAFSQMQDEALMRYDLHDYHWFEDGWALLRRVNGSWKLVGAGIEAVS
jgi:hypothetical protein